MNIETKVQTLSAGQRIRLVVVDGSAFDAPIMRIHPHAIPHTEADILSANGDETKLPAKSLWWRGFEYSPYPFEISGLGSDMQGEQATPTLTIGNLNGLVSALCRQFEDMVRAKIIIYETFADYIDARNYPTGQAITPDPNACYEWTFYIDSRETETYEAVTFQLANPVDLDGLLIPTRQITDVCTWACRGEYRLGRGCSYNGTAYFDKNGNPTSDPSKDDCGGLFSDCEKRFGEGSPLDFGGFVSSSLINK